VTATATATAHPASTTQAGIRAKPRRNDAMLMASPYGTAAVAHTSPAEHAVALSEHHHAARFDRAY